MRSQTLCICNWHPLLRLPAGGERFFFFPLFLSESFYADGLAALMPQTTISAVVCRIEMASINIVYGTAEGLRRNLPTTGPWQMEQHAQAQKTFNNPLLAPSPRFGRFLPEEAMPLSNPNLELFVLCVVFFPEEQQLEQSPSFAKRHLA